MYLSSDFAPLSIFESWDLTSKILTFKLPADISIYSDFDKDDSNNYYYSNTQFSSVELYYNSFSNANNGSAHTVKFSVDELLPITVTSKNYTLFNCVYNGNLNVSGGAATFNYGIVFGNINGSGSIEVVKNSSLTVKGDITVDERLTVQSNSSLTVEKPSDATVEVAVTVGNIENRGTATFKGDVTVVDTDGNSTTYLYDGSNTVFKGNVTIDNLNLEELQDITKLTSSEPIKVTKAITLPTAVTCPNCNDLIVELSEDTEIVCVPSITPEYDETTCIYKIKVQKYGYETGIQAYIDKTDKKPIEDFIPKINISEIIKNQHDVNKEDYILDLSEADMIFDPTIDTSDPINFTLLTTPSKGITIANGVSITSPVKIRLKLGGE